MHFTTKILKTAKLIFTLFLAYFAIRLLLYHYFLTVFPYSDMLREGAIMTNTQALVKGLNPYSMALQPQYTNEYGFVYPLLAWPWAAIFGTTILVHRIVTAVFVLACCILVFLVMRKMNIPFLLNIWAMLMLYASFLYPGTSTACIDPAATGVFFFLLTVFIPWFCRYSYKSLIVSVVFGVLAFYTKQYTMLGIAVMGSYLFLFVSKQKGGFYGALWLLLLCVSVPIINQTFPAYFDNCFFALVNMGPSWAAMDRLYLQLHLYGGLNKWLLMLMGLLIGWHTVKFFRSHSLEVIFRNIKNFFMSIKFNAFKEPLIKQDFPLVIFAGLWACLVLYMSLGRHTGATLWYFFQLLSPFFLITAVWLFSRQAFWPLLCVPFLVLTLYTMSVNEDYRHFDKRLSNWPQLADVISRHQNILNSALIVPLLIEENKPFYDNGQSEYFLPGGQRNYWLKGLKEDARVFYQQFLFFENIRDMVENKDFDLIILQPGLLPMGVGDDIRKFYKFQGGFSVVAPQDNRSYDLTVWTPL